MTKADSQSAFRVPDLLVDPPPLRSSSTFFGLTIPLVGPGRAAYAQVAREMFERGDWITPTLGGFTGSKNPPSLLASRSLRTRFSACRSFPHGSARLYLG